MLHFIGIIVEMYDGKEWSHKRLIKAETKEAAETKLKEDALTEFEDSEDDEERDFSDSIVHKTYIEQEIPAEHAEILSLYL